MTYRIFKKLFLIAGVFCLACVGCVSAAWTYYLPAGQTTHSVPTKITQWVYLPEGNDTTELGESYTGVAKVVLDDMRYGLNKDGLILQAFGDKKLLEQGVVHSAQNNLSGGALKNALAAANAEHLQFVVRQINGTDPIEYYLYMFEKVNDTEQIVEVYRVHLKTTVINGVSDGVYKQVEVKLGTSKTYSPEGANFVSVNPLLWVETKNPTT